MKKPVILIIIIVAVLGVIGVGVTRSDKPNDMHDSMHAQTSPMEVPKANEIYIQNFSFTPTKLTIKKGTTITWTNKDDAHHDINPDREYGDAFKPSKLLGKGETYSFTFNTAGTYSYHCTPHPYMKAMIEVTE